MPRELTAEQNLTVQGVTIPKLGLGTSMLRGDDCAEAVRDALELGYRHIDTAPSYGNEDAVGRGLAASGVARGDVLLTTKLSHEALDADGVPRQLAESLERLGTDYVDLTAYRPLAGSRLLDDEVMRDVAAAHGKTAGQVALRWLLDQPKVAAIPKASSHENRTANLDVFDFDLDDDERARIAELALRHERTIDPSFAPEWD